MPSRRKSGTPPKPRNPAARALRASPLFKQRVVANAVAYKRKRKFAKNPVDEVDPDENN